MVIVGIVIMLCNALYQARETCTRCLFLGTGDFSKIRSYVMEVFAVMLNELNRRINHGKASR
jgi:hypothetical protein